MYLSEQSKESMDKEYLCASYVRLSQDDGDKEESNSIINQKTLIRDYIKNHSDLTLIEEYADDGYSGVNFERPDFQRMMNDVKAKKIDCIVVKDLSRFGRNYIEVGRYLQQVFPFMGIRFIAINDSVDSGKKQTDAEQFVLPFKNLFNDSYCKDISIKVRSQLAIKRKNGDFVGSFACYGYLKNPADHNQLMIDEEVADIIRSIFLWKIMGLSADRIAEKLNSQGIPCPMEYKRSLGLKVSTNFRTNGTAKWSHMTVLRILKNDIYIGNMTQGKQTTPNYKVKRLIDKPEEEWDRVEGTHEAIISEDVFETVQALMLQDTRISPWETKVYLFSGYLFCGDCKMSMSRRTRKNKSSTRSYYFCSGYKRKNGCTSHNISEERLYHATLSAIQQQCRMITDIERVLRYAKDLPDDPNSLKRYDIQLAKLDEEIDKNQTMKLRLIENLNDGILSSQEYLDLVKIYDTRILEGRKAKQVVAAERAGLQDLPLESDWLTAFKKYQEITALDRIVLAELVERIEVYADKEIVIRFKFSDQIKRVQEYLAERHLLPEACPVQPDIKETPWQEKAELLRS
ncbi:MAG: recombinase family protein [Lachnospiraceae bacterium]|nr:recombinase family protein [Lachnospiraceae bacterium]